MSDYLWKTHHRLVQELDITSHRFLYDEFNLKNRLTGIIGPRGVGKTTLLLQYIKNNLYESGTAFYFSADSTYFNETSLLEFVDELYLQKGIRQVFIDEIHKYANWSQELKNIYDSFPKLHVVFSGSSSIDLVHGSHDLSRRAKLMHLPGLSFREYLNLSIDTNFEPISLDTLLSDHIGLSRTLNKTDNLLMHFENYKQFGYYPFMMGDQDSLYNHLNIIVDKTIFEDIAGFYPLKTANLNNLKRILNFLASIPPGKVNTSNIARHLSVDFKTVENYLEMLSRTGMVKMLYPVGHGNQLLSKPSKIYLDNASLLAGLNTLLSSELDIGTQRELTFLQSVSGAKIPVFHPQKGDFTIHENNFEIGGKNKTMQQLKGIDPDKRFLVKDNMLTGTKHEIPLHLFGFLY